MKKILTSVLMLLLSVSILFASDYVDDINNNTTKATPAGQRVIYEMNIGSFTSAGTLNAAKEKLSDLKQLGVDVVWLMPIYPRGTSGSPYAATNFKEVNPKYGTVANLSSFVSRAHELKMEVWLDWVPNHTATNAEWVTSHPEYYAKQNGQMIHPNNYGDVWQLDYNNDGLVNAMNDCLKFWIDKADVDGYRCDYVSSSYIPTSYWQKTIPLIKGYKNVTFLAETDIAQDVTRLKNVGFDYDYAWAFQSQMASFGTSGTNASTLKDNANRMISASTSVSFKRMLYLTNHDQNFNDGGKTLTQMYGNNRYPLTVLAYTLYGMPLIYNGQEYGGNQILNYFSDTKIDWNSKDNKMFNTIRTLTALKHSEPALSDNVPVSWKTVSNNTNVLAYTRQYGNSEVLVVLNFAATNVSATISGLTQGDWSLWLDSESIATGVSRKQQTLNSSHTFDLDGKGYRVYVRDTYSEEELPGQESYTPSIASNSEISVFFETSTLTTYHTWVWGDLGGGEAYCNNTNWPGDEMTLMGQSSEGKYIYKYVFTKVDEAPQYLIISKSDGNEKIYDGIDFVNHAYYVEGQGNPTRIISLSTGIRQPTITRRSSTAIYNLNGQVVTQPTRPGIYIMNGKKFVVK